MGANYTTDYDGKGVTYQPSHCVYVDFTDSGYSEGASGTEGYYDVSEELGVDWAFVHTESGGKLDVVFFGDDD